MRKKLALLSFLLLTPVLLFAAANSLIVRSSSPSIFNNISDLPQAQAVMILGSKVYSSGKLSDILLDRTLTAMEVYKSGKADKILVSGDHGTNEYDEVNTVKQYLLKNQVPEDDIFLDHAGFDTFDSLYRAKHIFLIESLIVSTQEFHQPRAVFIGNSLGIKTTGIISDRQPYVKSAYFQNREKLAQVKALLNVIFQSKSRYGGESIPITGDGRKTWD